MTTTMNLLSARSPARADGLPMLLVAVNLLLLSFFVLLNAMSAQPTSKEEKHADDVLARVREGYDQQAPKHTNQGNALPQAPVTSWAEAMTSKVQGVMTNRVQLQTEVLEADASRVVVRLPMEALFAGPELIGAELVKSLMLATQGARLEWQLAGNTVAAVSQGAALGAITGGIALMAGPPEMRIILTPAPTSAPSLGGSLSPLTNAPGVQVQGQSRP